jgi:beta-lactamase regulating signal transducer with metallopeptidase domain
MEWLVHAMLSNALVVTILTVLVAILGRACRRPALTHALWLVVMLKLVTPPVMPVSLPVGKDIVPASWVHLQLQDNVLSPVDPTESWQEYAEGSTDEMGTADRPSEESQGTTAANPPFGSKEVVDDGLTGNSFRDANLAISQSARWSWEYLVLALVLSGGVAWWTLAAVRIIRFQRLMKEIDPAPEDWQARTHELALRLGLSRAPALCLVPGRVPPMLWAIGGRPRLLVPLELWSATSLEERTSLLLHELAHLKRRDHWVRWLELIVGGLYWWHPAVWWSRRLLREAEEQCCDAWVIWAMPRGARTYATALLSALEFVSGSRTAPAASSATSGNGHVSCLKRRLRMIVRAQTPKSLSWAGRLAVLGMAVLLLPLAPSWGQNSDCDRAPAELDSAAVFDQDTTDIAQDQNQPNPPAARDENAVIQRNDREPEKDLELRILEQFQRDPEFIALSDELAAAEKERDYARSLARQPNDPARRVAEEKYKKLMDRFLELKKTKHDALLARLSQDDDKNDSKKDEGAPNALDDKGRETVERFAEHVKDLINTLTKELGPVSDELRKVLEKSVDEIHQTLKKENLTADDLRQALENSHNEMRRAFEKGGTIDKELRETWEKSRDDLRSEWERAQNDLRTAMRDRLESSRQRERSRLDQAARDRLQGSSDKDTPENDQDRAEIDKTQAEVRALQQQLREANRRLMDLQRRRVQRNARARRSENPVAKPAPERDSDAQPSPRGGGRANPRSARPPVPPATGATPRRVTPPNDMQPGRPIRPPGGPFGTRGGGMQPQYEERLRDLNDKLERLLKEVEELKGEKKSRDSKDSGASLAQPERSGALIPF